MKKNRLKLNNRGVALMTVIICMLFAAIIAVGVVTIATSNLDFASQQKRNERVNYSAEQVIDETKGSMKMYADEAYSTAIETALTTYAISGESSLQDCFMKEYYTELFDLLLHEGIIAVPAGGPVQSVVDKLYAESGTNEVEVAFGDLSAVIPTDLAGEGGTVKKSNAVTKSLMYLDGGNLVFKDLAFEYQDKYGNTSSVTTDLVMNVSFPGDLGVMGSGMISSGVSLLPTNVEEAAGNGYTVIAGAGIEGTPRVSGNYYDGSEGSIFAQYGDVDPLQNGKAIKCKVREVTGNDSYNLEGRIKEYDYDYPQYTTIDGVKYYLSNAAVTIIHSGNYTTTANIMAKGDVSVAMKSFSGVITTKGDVTIGSSTNFNGIILCGGDVKLLNGAKVTGTVIAKGKVKIDTYASIDQSSSEASSTYTTLIKNSPILPIVFKVTPSGGGAGGGGGGTPSGDGELYDGADMANNFNSISIEYDNWRKY